MYLLCFCHVFGINRLCNDELSLLHIMTHDHVEKWACPRSAGARLTTRETGYEASCISGMHRLIIFFNSCVDNHEVRIAVLFFSSCHYSETSDKGHSER